MTKIFQPGRWAAIFTALLLLIGLQSAPAYNVPDKMAWWYDARFGMFIHFGSYSELGHGEWAFSNENYTKEKYQNEVSSKFNPSNFDAAAIVGYAKAAGMKYIVITAKHHEGFAMWDSQVPSFTDVTGTKLYNLHAFAGFNRDVLGELRDECQRQGIKFCLYYSILDWNHPSQTIRPIVPVFSTMASDQARTDYIRDMKAQLKELITRYDPASLWFDGDWCGDATPPNLVSWWTKADGVDLYQYLIGLKPTLVVNERVKRDFGLGDYACAEASVPPAPLKRQWESCQTMNSAWGYDRSKDGSYKSADSLIQELVQTESRDGNYLLNIGPKGDGSVPEGAVHVLKGLADWMKDNSESVHGVTASPFSKDPGWGYFTKKNDMLYIHVFKWPSDGKLAVPALANTVNRIYSLSDRDTALDYTTSNTSLNITVPQHAANSADSVLAVEMSGMPTAALNSEKALDDSGSASGDHL